MTADKIHDQEILDECRALALSIAPELGDGPLYLIGDEAGGAATNNGCGVLGWAQPRTSPATRELLGDRWNGDGPLISLDLRAIGATSQPGQFKRCAQAVLVHEVAHVVPRVDRADDLPDLRIDWDRKILRHQLSEASPGFGDDPMHDDGFVRRAVHCWARASLCGFAVPVESLLPWPAVVQHYLGPLIKECVDMRDATFAEIAKEPLPAGVALQFASDKKFARDITDRSRFSKEGQR